MSDLIININISESKKKGRIVLETYNGAIPKLKSKQFSGPLKNANINGLSIADNLSTIELETIRNYLNLTQNVQINKYQYILSNSGIYELQQFVKYGCLFYKDKSSPMFCVENILFNDKEKRDYIGLNDIEVAYSKTNLYIKIDVLEAYDKVRYITAKAYVDISSKTHNLQLYFDYDDFSINYEEERRSVGTSNDYRDYGFEERIVLIIKNHGWTYNKNTGFSYIGHSFQDDIISIIDEGISVYTESQSHIVKGNFSGINVSYGIDWFEIKGNISFENEFINITDLINFKVKDKNWIEINGNILYLPESLNSTLKQTNIVGDSLRINKDQIINAIEIAYDTNQTTVENIEQLIDFESINLDVESNLFSLLRPYQETGVKWMMALDKNGFGGCLADDMGLGKTLQVITYLSDYTMQDSKNLIIVPKTLILNWEKEFKKFSPSISILIYHGSGRETKHLLEYNVVITTYGTVLNDLDKLIDYEFNNLIIDEAQYIKNPKTKIYKAINKLRAHTRLILTGTPVENNIQEYWGLMKLINPTIFYKVNPFVKNVDNNQIVSRIKRITAPFILRRVKNDVLSDLPEKQEQTLYCKMDVKQQELYNKMLVSIQHEINRKSEHYEIKSNSIMLNGLLYLQEICCHPQLLSKEYNPDGCRESAKLDQLLDVLEGLYSSGHKVVIFSRFTRMLRIIEKKLIHMHYNYFYLDGQTNNRIEIVDEFEESNNGIFLISLKAGGTGINLVSADTAIIYDPWWNPAIEKQAEDRIYRIGQTRKVMIYKMIVENTIEEKVQSLQKEKSKLYDEILSGHDVPIKMTTDIIRELLMNN